MGAKLCSLVSESCRKPCQKSGGCYSSRIKKISAITYGCNMCLSTYFWPFDLALWLKCVKTWEAHTRTWLVCSIKHKPGGSIYQLMLFHFSIVFIVSLNHPWKIKQWSTVKSTWLHSWTCYSWTIQPESRLASGCIITCLLLVEINLNAVKRLDYSLMSIAQHFYLFIE